MPAFNFQKLFAPAVESGEKNQTIRAKRKDGRQPAKRGDILALYTGMRTKQCRKLRESPCIDIQKIYIDWGIAVCGDGWIRDESDLDIFAKQDGFDNWQKLTQWFEETHGLPFEGWLIEWSPLSENTIQKEGENHEWASNCHEY